MGVGDFAPSRNAIALQVDDVAAARGGVIEMDCGEPEQRVAVVGVLGEHLGVDPVRIVARATLRRA